MVDILEDIIAKMNVGMISKPVFPCVLLYICVFPSIFDQFQFIFRFFSVCVSLCLGLISITKGNSGFCRSSTEIRMFAHISVEVLRKSVEVF